MKKVECIIRPSKLEAVKDMLFEIGVHGMTVSNVLGCGTQRGKTEVYRGNKYTINLLPKIKIEIVVTDDVVFRLLPLLSETARTGEFGDGKIFVYNLEDAVRIRTGESGASAV